MDSWWIWSTPFPASQRSSRSGCTRRYQARLWHSNVIGNEWNEKHLQCRCIQIARTLRAIKTKRSSDQIWRQRIFLSGGTLYFYHEENKKYDIFQRKNVKDKKNESMTMFLFISKYVPLYGVTAILVHLGLGPCKPNASLAWFSWPSLSFSHPSMFQGQLQTHITSSKKVPSCCWREVKQWVLSIEF